MTRRLLLGCLLAATAAAPAAEPWVGPMRKVHARFTGQAGTVAQIGDSITITMAFFVPLRGKVRNLPEALEPAHEWVRSHVQNRCWEAWKGAEFGNTGMMTSRWGAANIDRWLKRMNPEVALVMFGTNDTYAGPRPPKYTENMRAIVRACTANGTVPILYTIPPVGSQAGSPEKTRQVESFVEAVREVADGEKVPLIDFYAEIMARRPKDFAKTLLGDNLHPSYPAAHQRDFSEAGLKSSGYTLRNYLTLKMMYEVYRKVLSAVDSARDPSKELRWTGPTHGGRPAILIGEPAAAPTVDGGPDEAAWKGAARLPLRMLDGDTRRPTHPTTVQVCADRSALYVAFRCTESGEPLSRKRPPDGQVWADDCVEVFLLPGPRPTRDYYHLIVNPDGSRLTARGKNAKAWDPSIDVAVRRRAEGDSPGWTVEVRIPFSEIDLPTNRRRLAAPWRINLTRTRQPRKDRGQFIEDTALSPTEHTDSHRPRMFAVAWLEAFGGRLPAKKGD